MEIKLEAIAKSFGGVQALKHVDLTAYSGEVHALVGENGAGKSTLMKILSGVITDYQGRLLFDGQEQRFPQPKAAELAGVSIIHQELSAFPHLTVAENMFVGRWPKRGGCIEEESIQAQAQAALERVGAGFSPLTPMAALSTGDQQLVEIAKALMRNSRVLILDEPTSSLSQKESERLFSLIRELRGAGKILFYISHRMEEIFSLCQRITVLRDGSSVLSVPASDITEAELVKAMVGREMGSHFPPRPQKTVGAEILRLENFSAQIGGRRIGPLNLSAKAGEIIGFGGLLGSGRTEILRALMGDESFATMGKSFFKGQEMSQKSLRTWFGSGVGALSEDRKRESILPSLSLTDNYSVLKHGLRGLFSPVNPASEEQQTAEALKKLRTRFHSTEQKITGLSGGNQQKVILARILQEDPDLLFLDEPTRGVDVGAKYEIYEILFALAAAGKTILLVSSDLPELLALSDRIVVMAKGKVQGELAQFNQESVMQLAVQ